MRFYHCFHSSWGHTKICFIVTFLLFIFSLQIEISYVIKFSHETFNFFLFGFIMMSHLQLLIFVEVKITLHVWLNPYNVSSSRIDDIWDHSYKSFKSRLTYFLIFISKVSLWQQWLLCFPVPSLHEVGKMIRVF